MFIFSFQGFCVLGGEGEGGRDRVSFSPLACSHCQTELSCWVRMIARYPAVGAALLNLVTRWHYGGDLKYSHTNTHTHLQEHPSPPPL